MLYRKPLPTEITIISMVQEEEHSEIRTIQGASQNGFVISGTLTKLVNGLKRG